MRRRMSRSGGSNWTFMEMRRSSAGSRLPTRLVSQHAHPLEALQLLEQHVGVADLTPRRRSALAWVLRSEWVEAWATPARVKAAESAR